MQQNLAWKPWTRPGVEHLKMNIASNGVSASSHLIQSIHGHSIAAAYLLEYDEHWHFQRLWLKVDNHGQRCLALHRDSHGRWLHNGQPREDLGECQQVMLSASPFTHTPLLQHSALAAGDSQRLSVVHIDMLNLRIEARQLHYQCRLRQADHTLYQYEAQDQPPCELTLDEDGLPLQATGQFIRIHRQILRHPEST